MTKRWIIAATGRLVFDYPQFLGILSHASLIISYDRALIHVWAPSVAYEYSIFSAQLEIAKRRRLQPQPSFLDATGYP